MSIIAEALKKAESGLQKEVYREKERLERRERKKPPPARTRRAGTRFSLKGFAVILSAVLLVLSAAGIPYFLARKAAVKTDYPVALSTNADLPLADSIISRAGPVVFDGDEKEVPDEVKAAESPLSVFESVRFPTATGAEVKEAIRLTGIMYTTEKPLAVINNAIWRENDYVDKFKILRIGKDFVTVSRGGEEFIVRLKR